jgi:hypothetical protein
VATVNVDGVVQTKSLGRTVIRATALDDILNDDEVCNYQGYLICLYVANLLLAAGCAFTCPFLTRGEFFEMQDDC